jgi:hypothetical protein
MGYSDYLKMYLRAASSVQPFCLVVNFLLYNAAPSMELRILGNLSALDRRDMINAAINLTTQLIHDGG